MSRLCDGRRKFGGLLRRLAFLKFNSGALCLHPALMRSLIPVSAVIDSRRTFLSAVVDKGSKPYSAKGYDNEYKHYGTASLPQARMSAPARMHAVQGVYSVTNLFYKSVIISKSPDFISQCGFETGEVRMSCGRT